ncbi:hypothetical protein CASFOL_023108 [Castilleja foliolosa]|uniref:Cytochrome P450 n=1 Tax=Castilleja foliolosa TaxID=1961234 RepID=A0ABD3CLN1_9LAMI
MGCYLEIVLAVIVCTILFFLLSPKNWPLIRIIPTAYFQNHKLYNKLTQVLAENKGTILLKTSLFTSTDILVTSDPANVQHVMNSNYSTYQRGSEFRKAFDFLGGAAFIKDLDEWRQEKKFTHAFYKEIEFQKSTPKITHHTLQKGLIPVLDQASKHKHVLDLQVLFNRYMLDATCLLATGFDLGSLLVGSPLLDAMDDISEAVFYRHVLPERVWKMQRWLRIGKEKKFGEAVKVLNRILDEYVSKKYETEEATSRGFDVLRFYLANISKSTKQDEKSYLCFNIMTLLFAGRDTSAALLTWFFYVVSENPLVEKNILQEISETISTPEAKLSPYLFYDVEKLSKLVYLHGALTEGLRLFPTAPVIIRDPIEEDVLPSGHRV